MKKSYQNTLHKKGEPHSYKHDLGQHFLYDEPLLASLVESTGVTSEDYVLEIGAGSGMLTAELCKRCKQVISIEVDEQVLPFLRMKTDEFNNITIVKGDVRKLDLTSICADFSKPFYVIANIPYNITTSIFELLWHSGLKIKQISVMIQKEVAEKLIASPSSNGYGFLSVQCQYYSIPSIVGIVPAEAFTPPPKVDSAFITLDMRREPPLPVLDEKILFRMIKASFQLRRKTLPNALGGVTDVAKLKQAMSNLDIPLTIRGEALSIQQWISLANEYVTLMGN